MEGDRLDALQAAVWEKALAGDPKAVDQCLQIIDRRAKLFGLGAEGSPGGKRRVGMPVVLDEYWEHVREAHDGDWSGSCHQAE